MDIAKKTRLARTSGSKEGCNSDPQSSCQTTETPAFIIAGVISNSSSNSVAGLSPALVSRRTCLRCLHILNDHTIAEEAKKYGAVGGQPQVVWPNGVLASTAVGLLIEMFTPWHTSMRPVACLEYDGNTHTMHASNFLGHVTDGECSHYVNGDVGDLFFKLPTS